MIIENKKIDKIVASKLEELNQNGYLIGGHNGPYYDPETPVRNTAHWTCIFSHYYNETKDQKYYSAVKKCSEYLLSVKARPMNATFFCRTNKLKDFSNGTIGQAWAIEGIVEAYKTIKDERLI